MILTIFTVCLILFSNVHSFEISELREKVLSETGLDEVTQECGKEYGLKKEDVVTFFNIEAPKSKELLCFAKCLQQKRGAIDSNGKIVIEMMEKMPIYDLLEQDQKTELLKCSGGIEKIETCEDIQKQLDCFSRAIKI